MKGFPKVLKTKEDYYNCLAMVASGELAAADLLAKIESAENQRYIECGVAAVEEEKKAVTVYYCDEAAVGMKFVAGDVSGTVQGVTYPDRRGSGSRRGRKRQNSPYTFQSGKSGLQGNCAGTHRHRGRNDNRRHCSTERSIKAV